jgi:mRNA interferase RelE/StbE
VKLQFKSSFLKDLRAVKVKSVRARIEELIVAYQKVNKLDDISNLKKLAGTDSFYRVRIGNYRLGLVLEGDTLVFVRLLHRKDIYRYFP